MNVLILTSHPVRRAFSGTLARALEDGLEEAGHKVRRADLAAEGFSPVMTAGDMAQFTGARPPKDIEREMKRVDWADTLAFVYPVWWWSMPAQMKGWLDRVLRVGWAWTDPASGKTPGLKPRRILALATLGEAEDTPTGQAMTQALRGQFETGTWDFCGASQVSMHFFYDLTPDAPKKRYKAALKKAKKIGRKL